MVVFGRPDVLALSQWRQLLEKERKKKKKIKKVEITTSQVELRVTGKKRE